MSREHLKNIMYWDQFAVLFFVVTICGNVQNMKPVQESWVKVFRTIPEFRILRLTFHRKSASKF